MKVKVLEYREYARNTMQGFVELEIEEINIVLKGCTYHIKGDKSWVGLPAKEYEDKSGTKQWENMVCFTSNGRSEFQESACLAMKRYLTIKDQSGDVRF